MARHTKMYRDSPTLERDEETGGMKKSKKKGPTEAEKKSSEVSSGTAGMEQHAEGVPMVARHAMERHGMHGRHEMEHTVHDHSGAGDKHEMHARHAKEMADMHKRHEKEATKGSGDGKEKISKVEKGE